MQAFPVSRNSVTQIARVHSRAMPTPQVQKTMVMQPVNLRPLGNTVSMAVRAENPFTAGRPIRVVTQASGGMAKADPAMRTQARFLPIGLGGLGELSVADEAYGAFNRMDPAAQDINAFPNRAAYDASPKRIYWEGEVNKWRAAKAQESSVNWSKAGDIFASTVGAGVNIATSISDAKKKTLELQIAQAKADAAKYEVSQTQAFLASMGSAKQTMENMEKRKEITIPLLAIGGGALLIALFLFLKKKNTAPAAA
jgi:hypothetical protein